jgi:TolA-binding protein
MALRFLILFAIFSLIMTACESKKTEVEYFQIAYDFYNDQHPEKAIENFKKLLDYYPDGEKAADAMFMIGFIYANNLENFDEARIYYNRFIEKYPDHELVASARYELKTLGKDINELDIFDKMKQDTSVGDNATQ